MVDPSGHRALSRWDHPVPRGLRVRDTEGTEESGTGQWKQRRGREET